MRVQNDKPLRQGKWGCSLALQSWGRLSFRVVDGPRQWSLHFLEELKLKTRETWTQTCRAEMVDTNALSVITNLFTRLQWKCLCGSCRPIWKQHQSGPGSTWDRSRFGHETVPAVPVCGLTNSSWERFFLCIKRFICSVLTEMYSSSFSSWESPFVASGKRKVFKRFWCFWFPVPVQFLGYPAP